MPKKLDKDEKKCDIIVMDDGDDDYRESREGVFIDTYSYIQGNITRYTKRRGIISDAPAPHFKANRKRKKTYCVECGEEFIEYNTDNGFCPFCGRLI